MCKLIGKLNSAWGRNSARWATIFFVVAFGLMLLSIPRNSFSLPVPESFADLAQQVGPAVVNISVVKSIKTQGVMPMPQRPGRGEMDPFEEFFKRFFGDQMPREYRQKGLGTGFIYDPQGYVITNNHVVDDAEKIEVRLVNKKTYEAEVVGRDSKTDLAVLKLKGEGPFPTVKWGNSDQMRVGDWVIAVGNPFGLENTVTAGIISATQRNIGAGPYDDFLQTDASINPGNSGGPLLNTKGEVVGINTAIVAAGQGIGFAIPSNLAKNVIDQLKVHGKVVRGWLGVMIQPISPEMAKSFSLKSPEGALVADVPQGSPADKAGIKRGDVIVEFDGKVIKESSELPSIVATTPIGKTVDVKIVREGKERVLQVTIQQLQEEETGGGATKPTHQERVGMVVSEITPAIRQQLGVKDETGVVIMSVEQGTPAEEAGLRPGDIIKEIQREPVKGMSDYERLISKNVPAEGAANLLMLVKRGNNTLFVSVQLS